MASELTKKEIQVSESRKPKRTLLTGLIMTAGRGEIKYTSKRHVAMETVVGSMSLQKK